jgi:hypothetical protein
MAAQLVARHPVQRLRDAADAIERSGDIELAAGMREWIVLGGQLERFVGIKAQRGQSHRSLQGIARRLDIEHTLRHLAEETGGADAESRARAISVAITARDASVQAAFGPRLIDELPSSADRIAKILRGPKG